MNALEIAKFNRQLAHYLYNAALVAHSQQPWNKDLSEALSSATRAYQNADDQVIESPGYKEQFK